MLERCRWRVGIQLAHVRAESGAVVGSGTNITFVPDDGSFVCICLESETYVCSFSSELLFSFELLNLYVFSMYALFLPFCSSRSSRAWPRHRCLQLYLGAEPEGLDPYCYCMFLLLGAEPEGLDPYCYCFIIIRGRARRARPLLLLYVLLLLLLLLLFFFFQWESMAALWREHGKMMKFGTLLGMVINSDLTNFGVSKTTSIAPPPVQKFNIEMVITREPLSLEKWNLVHLITLIILITCNSLQ